MSCDIQTSIKIIYGIGIGGGLGIGIGCEAGIGIGIDGGEGVGGMFIIPYRWYDTNINAGVW